MSDKPKLSVDVRKIVGRKVKKLRREGKIPANISGKGIKSLAIEMPVKEFKKIFAKVGETSLIDLEVVKETKTRPVLIHLVQIHPVTDEIQHVDFRQVDLTKKVIVSVPLEIIGVSPAIAQGGVLIQLLSEVEVEALPLDLPEKFSVDVSALETIGQGITLKDIKVDSSKVRILAENMDELVVKVEEPTKEEVVEAPVVPVEGEAAAPVAEGDKKVEEKKEAVKPEAKAGSGK